MPRQIVLKAEYTLARCCSPTLEHAIVGYFSHDQLLKVHRHDCSSLRKAEQARLVSLSWDDILADAKFQPEEDYNHLDATDFAILAHHREYGIDYSLMVARMLRITRQQAFDRHDKLRGMGLISRVEAKIVRYRKGVVDNKWIKHRNHSYFELTEKGNRYLDFFLTKN